VPQGLHAGGQYTVVPSGGGHQAAAGTAVRSPRAYSLGAPWCFGNCAVMGCRPLDCVLHLGDCCRHLWWPILAKRFKIEQQAAGPCYRSSVSTSSSRQRAMQQNKLLLPLGIHLYHAGHTSVTPKHSISTTCTLHSAVVSATRLAHSTAVCRGQLMQGTLLRRVVAAAGIQ